MSNKLIVYCVIPNCRNRNVCCVLINFLILNNFINFKTAKNKFKFCSREKLRERDHLGELVIDGRICKKSFV